MRPKSRAAGVWVQLLLVAAVALGFARSLSGTFVFDDRSLVEQNRFIRDPRNAARAFTSGFWGATEIDLEAGDRARVYNRPLVTLSFILDYQIHGQDAWGYHLTNLLLHILVMLLVHRLVTRVVARESANRPRADSDSDSDSDIDSGAAARWRRWVPAILTLLFAFHPSRAEAVSWISGRTDLLATLFSLAALLLFWRALERTSAGVFTALLAWVALVAALLSKELAVVVAPLVLVLDWLLIDDGRTTRDRLRRHLLRFHLPLLALTLAYTVWVIWRLGGSGGGPGAGLNLQSGALVLRSLGHYALLVASPYQPNMQIGAFTDPAGLDAWLYGLAGLTLLVALALALQRAIKHHRRVQGFGLLLLFLPLLPVLALAPLGLYVLAAERYLYMPLTGLVVLAALGARHLASRPRPVRAGFAALVLLLGVSWLVALQVRQGDFANRARFWRSEVAASPQNPKALGGLAEALFDAGALVSADRHFLAAYRAWEPHPWGVAYRIDALHQLLRLRLATKPADAGLFDAISRFTSRLLGPPAGAATLALDGGALRLNLEDPRTRAALLRKRPQLLLLAGEVLSQVGDDPGALRALRAARRLRPRRVEAALALALAQARARSLTAARRSLREARTLAAGDRRVADLQRLLDAAAPRIRALRAGSSAATKSNVRARWLLAELFMVTRATARACRQLRQVIRLSPNDRRAWSMLALELATAGDLPGALKVVQRARGAFGAEQGLVHLEQQVRQAHAQQLSRLQGAAPRSSAR
jgi:Flp pilus assembly protein TadD